MGKNEGYRLRLSGFSVKYKKGREDKRYKLLDRIFLLVYFLVLFIFIFWDKILNNNFFRFGIIFLIFLMILVRIVMDSGSKKDIGLKKEICVKSENKNLCFYNAGDHIKRLELQYKNNDFLYRRRILGGLVLVIDGTVKEYYFYISKKDKKSDYKDFFNDLEKNYIERIKFCTWKNAGRFFIFLYIGMICLVFIKELF